MLSGQAKAKDVGDALRLGFTDYVHKSEIKVLPEHVLQEYTKYEVDIRKKAQIKNPTHFYSETVKVGWLLRSRINYYIVNIQVIDENYIFDNL